MEPYPISLQLLLSSMPWGTVLTGPTVNQERVLVRLALPPSLSAQSRQETQLPLAGAWGARDPVLGDLCLMTLRYRAGSAARCQPRA